MGPVFEEVPHLQQLAPSSSLVTYRVAAVAAASNSQDALPATAAPVAHFPGRGSNRRCQACPTTAADWPVYWPLGTPGWNNIFGVPDSGNRGRISSYSADTCSERRAGSSSRKSPSLKAQPSDRKPEENPTAKKTEKEEKNRLRLNLGKKTEREEDNNFKSAFSPRFQPGPVIFCLIWASVLLSSTGRSESVGAFPWPEWRFTISAATVSSIQSRLYFIHLGTLTLFVSGSRFEI